MAKAFIVVKNGRSVVARADSKAEAEQIATALRDASPMASFEFGKLNKRLFGTKVSHTITPSEETY